MKIEVIPYAERGMKGDGFVIIVTEEIDGAEYIYEDVLPDRMVKGIINAFERRQRARRAMVICEAV